MAKGVGGVQLILLMSSPLDLCYPASYHFVHPLIVSIDSLMLWVPPCKFPYSNPRWFFHQMRHFWPLSCLGIGVAVDQWRRVLASGRSLILKRISMYLALISRPSHFYLELICHLRGFYCVTICQLSRFDFKTICQQSHISLLDGSLHFHSSLVWIVLCWVLVFIVGTLRLLKCKRC